MTEDRREAPGRAPAEGGDEQVDAPGAEKSGDERKNEKDPRRPRERDDEKRDDLGDYDT